MSREAIEITRPFQSGPVWIGRTLFLGRTSIGQVEPAKEAGKWLALSHLPGASHLIGRECPTEQDARAMVDKSANSRINAMFGAGIETTATAVSEGRKLRVIARAIYRAGVWTCDRPAHAADLFEDLRLALGLPEDARPAPAKPGEYSGANEVDTGENEVIE